MKSAIHIAADALRANFRAIQETAGPGYDILCVLKADAYGHGAALCAPVLVEAGAHWLGVADLEEGIAVRKALLHAGLADRPVHILTMCGFEPEDAPGLIEHRLTPVIWTPEHIEALEHAARPLNRRVAVHIEVDTGMARQGVRPDEDLDRLARRLWASPFLRCEGIFSHLSSAEVAHSPVTAVQEKGFQQAMSQGFDLALPEYVHLGNSSAVDGGSTLSWLTRATFHASQQCLVRPGLALYGYALSLTTDPDSSAAAEIAPPPRLSPKLHPVATWKTHIIGTRDLQPGNTVGYGATFTAPTPMLVALLPTGYADGFRREASSGLGNGWVMIGNKPAPVVGRVSMNLTVVDVTNHTPAPNIGDGVILLGPGVTAHDHARWANTIPYEILCGLRGHRRLI